MPRESPTKTKLKKIVETRQFTRTSREQVQASISQYMLTNSCSIGSGNFSKISGSDLGLLFHVTDEYFFEGSINRLCEQLADRPLSFRRHATVEIRRENLKSRSLLHLYLQLSKMNPPRLSVESCAATDFRHFNESWNMKWFIWWKCCFGMTPTAPPNRSNESSRDFLATPNPTTNSSHRVTSRGRDWAYPKAIWSPFRVRGKTWPGMSIESPSGPPCWSPVPRVRCTTTDASTWSITSPWIVSNAPEACWFCDELPDSSGEPGKPS